MAKFRITRGVVAVVAVLGLSACWPSPDHDPNRSSYNSIEGQITQATVGDLVESWVAPLDDQPAGTPVLSSSHVHVVAGDWAYGFDIHTGARRWKSSAAGDVISHEVADASPDLFVRGGELMTSAITSFGGGSAWTTYLDPRTGAVLRTSQPGGFVDSVREPNTAGSIGHGADLLTPYATLVVNGPGGGEGWLNLGEGVASLARTTLGADAVYASAISVVGSPRGAPSGATVWDDFGPGVRAYPKGVPTGCTIEPILNVSPDFSNLACPTWVATLDDTSASAPVLSPNGPALYVTTGGGHVYALDRTDGSVLWSAPLGSAGGQPALAAGRLYVPTASDGLQVFDAAGCGAATCSPTWSVPVSGTPSVAGDVLYLGGTSTIRAYPADGGGGPTCAPLWSADAGGTAGKVVVSNGRVYVVVTGRGLVAYRLPA